MVSPLRRRSSTSGYKSNKSCQVDTAQTQRELLSAALYGQRLNQLHRKIVFYDEFLAEQDDANGAMTSRYEPLKTSK